MCSHAPATGNLTAVTTGGHLREPVLLITGILRSIGASVEYTDNPLATRASAMSENVFFAPSVFNYYSPLYRIPGGWYGPEFQILSQSSALARANFVYSAITNRLGVAVYVNMQQWIDLAADPAQLVEALNQALLHGRLSPDARASIVTAISVTKDPAVRARNALYLVGSSSQYQVEQ